VEGGKRKQESFDPESVGLKAEKTKEESLKLVSNPFFRLEHEFNDIQKAKATIPRLNEMIDVNQQIWKDDFTASRSARARLRVEKIAIADQQKKVKDLKTRLAIHDLPLLPEHEEDKKKASEEKFRRAEPLSPDLGKIKQSTLFKKNPETRKTSSAQALLSKARFNQSGKSVISQLDISSSINMNKRRKLG
jgi:coiled-coil domain-containing protein 130